MLRSTHCPQERHTNQNLQRLKLLPILKVKILFPQSRNNFFSNFLKLECTCPSKEVYTNVDSNFVCNSQKLGFTHMLGNRWIFKQTQIHPHSRGLPISIKEGTHSTYSMPICQDSNLQPNETWTALQVSVKCALPSRMCHVEPKLLCPHSPASVHQEEWKSIADKRRLNDWQFLLLCVNVLFSKVFGEFW